MAYLEQKNEYVDIIIKKFKEYYSELKESEKETGVKIELDKTTKLFGISPSVALNLKRIQNKIRR